MARIQTYPNDGNISVNDRVIGSDGDSLEATKNYRVLTFLDYLGRLYNLNSTDLLFDYNNVTSSSVGNGQVSTNNFADGTILMSGVTNIYVSKVTAFGQLVEDILNTIGDNNLSIMFTDMGNRNNLGIFTVTSAVDVDANTINLSVTASTTSGNIVTGRVMGIRIGVGGGGGSTPSDVVYGPTWDDNMDAATKNVLYDKIQTLVTLNTVQTITAGKVFNVETNHSGGIYVGLFGVSNPSANRISFANVLVPSQLQAANSPSISFSNDNFVVNRSGTNTEDTYYIFNGASITSPRTYTLPNKSGTVALLDDVPSTPTTSTTTPALTVTTNTLFTSSPTVISLTTREIQGVVHFTAVLTAETVGETGGTPYRFNATFLLAGKAPEALTAAVGTMQGLVDDFTTYSAIQLDSYVSASGSDALFHLGFEITTSGGGVVDNETFIISGSYILA